MDKFTQLTQFIIDCGVTGYYFVYFLIKLAEFYRNRPGIEDAKPLALDNKPHQCCLHPDGQSGCTAASHAQPTQPSQLSPRTGKPQTTGPDNQPFWQKQQQQQQKSNTYVFQVGGVKQDRPQTSAAAKAAPSQSVANAKAAVTNAAANIGSKIGEFGKAAGSVGYSVLASPVYAAQYIGSSLSKIPVPSVPIPSFGGKKKDDKKPKADSRPSPQASGWTPSEPRSVSPPRPQQQQQPSPPQQQQQQQQQQAAAAQHVSQALSHARQPSYPAAFDGNMAAATPPPPWRNANQPSASDQSGSRPGSLVFHPPPQQLQLHKVEPPTQGVVLSPQMKMVTQSQVKTTFRQAVPEFGSSYSSPQQQQHSPAAAAFNPVDQPQPYKQRDIRGVQQQEQAKPQTQVKLRILSQEVHDLTGSNAPPPVPAHGPKPFAPQQQQQSVTHETSAAAPPRMQMSMFTSQSGSQAAPAQVLSSHSQRAGTPAASIDWFSARPFENKHHWESQPQQQQQQVYEPKPPAPQPQQQQQLQVNTWAASGGWTPAAAAAEGGASSHHTPQASPIPPPPAPPRPRSISQQRATPPPDQSNHPADVARVLQSALPDTTQAEIQAKAESFSARKGRSQSESRWRSTRIEDESTEFRHAVRNPQGDVNDWQHATVKYGAVNSTMFGPEASRDISSSLFGETPGQQSRGASMFARRRQKADEWVHEPNVAGLVDSVNEAAARKGDHWTTQSQSNASFSSSVAGGSYLGSEPATPMSTSSHPLFSPSTDYGDSSSSALFSPQQQQQPPQQRLFSPERSTINTASNNYNATPKDWKSYAQQYSRY